MKVATIDIGTNSIRLLLGEICDNVLRVMDSRVASTRLGQGILGGMISEPAIQRSIIALEDYAKLISLFAPHQVWAVATSAVRDAVNGREFLQLVFEKTGISIELISGEQEAKLGYLGVTAGLVADAGTYVLDIGGGSTEMITAVKAQVYAKSLQVGAVRMTEGAHSLVDIGQLIQMGYADLPIAPQRLIGVGGTVTTLAAVAQQLVEYRPSLIHGYVLTKDQVNQIYARLNALSLEERRKVPGLQPQRADIILAGVAILRLVMEQFAIESLTVSEADLLVGLIRYHGFEVGDLDFSPFEQEIR